MCQNTEEQKNLNEQKKEYLKGYGVARRKAERLRQQIRKLQSDQLSISSRQDGMPRGSGTSDLSGYAAKLDGLLRRLEADMLDAMTTYTLIYDSIGRMEDALQREVLERRYLMGQHWEQIAVEMNYNYRWVLRIHGRALDNFEIPEISHEKPHRKVVLW